MLGLQGSDQHHRLCLSRHFLRPCVSVWWVTRFSPVGCHLLDPRDGLTPGILAVPHPSVRPPFPDYLIENLIPTALPMLHPGLFSPQHASPSNIHVLICLACCLFLPGPASGMTVTRRQGLLSVLSPFRIQHLEQRSAHDGCLESSCQMS